VVTRGQHQCDIRSRTSKRRSCKCACFGIKNIGKPCALISYTRLDEEGQTSACSLLYPSLQTRPNGRANGRPFHTQCAQSRANSRKSVRILYTYTANRQLNFCKILMYIVYAYKARYLLMFCGDYEFWFFSIFIAFLQAL